MNKIKDFIYDKNDIVIAILILVVAAGVILWRMDIILAYPKTLFDGDNPVVESPSDGDENLPPSGEGEKSPVSDDEDKDSDGDNDDKQGEEEKDNREDKDTNANTDADAESNDTETVPTVIPLWDGGVLTEDVEVDVQGASSEAAVGCLVSEGLFADYDEYKKVCEDAGLDHEKVAAGTFTFKTGTTKAQIAKMVNWG